MKRYLFNFASLFSLLLLMTTVVLWVRSRFVADYFEWTTGYDSENGNDFHRFWIMNRGGGFSLWDNIHLQGSGGFAGGAYKVPLGRHFEWERDSDTSYPKSALTFTRVFRGGKLTSWAHIGCEIVLARSEEPEYGFLDRTVSVILPLPLIAASMAILPAFALARLLRRACRAKRTGCTSCGYSLTGNLSGVCPECGTAMVGRTRI